MCPNGNYQINTDENLCSRWFEVNVCSDSTCDTITGTSTQTRCDLDHYAANHFLKDAGITSSGQICNPSYSPGVPVNSHSTNIYVDAWKLCPYCCNYCNATDILQTTTTKTTIASTICKYEEKLRS